MRPAGADLNFIEYDNLDLKIVGRAGLAALVCLIAATIRACYRRLFGRDVGPARKEKSQ